MSFRSVHCFRLNLLKKLKDKIQKGTNDKMSLSWLSTKRERERDYLNLSWKLLFILFQVHLKMKYPIIYTHKKKKKKKKGTVSLWHGVAFLFVLPCSWWWSFHLHELSTNQRLFWTWKLIIDGLVYSLHQAHLDYNFFH